MSQRKFKRNIISNTITNDCQMLVNDFFAVAENRLGDVKLIDVRDLVISDEPITSEILGKVLFRCEQSWKHYCTMYGLPSVSHRMLRARIKKRWERMGERSRFT